MPAQRRRTSNPWPAKALARYGLGHVSDSGSDHLLGCCCGHLVHLSTQRLTWRQPPRRIYTAAPAAPSASPSALAAGKKRGDGGGEERAGGFRMPWPAGSPSPSSLPEWSTLIFSSASPRRAARVSWASCSPLRREGCQRLPQPTLPFHLKGFSGKNSFWVENCILECSPAGAGTVLTPLGVPRRGTEAGGRWKRSCAETHPLPSLI